MKTNESKYGMTMLENQPDTKQSNQLLNDTLYGSFKFLNIGLTQPTIPSGIQNTVYC